MISLFGTTLGSSMPLLLTGIPIALGLLVYAYRNRGSSRQGVVSTLFLLRNLPQRLTARRKFVPPIQFWIELLALTSLSLAAAGLFIKDSGKRIAVVIDTSLSMQAPGVDAASRLDSAKRQAQSDIAQSAPTTRFVPFSANTSLVPLTVSAVGSIQAASLISNLAPTASQDRLQGQVNTLASSDDYDAVWVYTDYTFEPKALSPRLRVSSVSAPLSTSSLENIWIRSAQVHRREDSTSLIVSLQAIARKNISAAIRANCYQDTEDGSNIPTDLPKATVELRPATPVSIELGPIKNPWSYCSIRAVPISDNFQDSISQDDQAWVTHSDSEAAVQLTSPLSPEQLNITRIGDLQVVAANEQTGDAPRIIHRTQISAAPKGPALLVFPPSGALPWGGSVKEALPNQQLEIARWVESHPLLRYVKPTLLNLTRSQILDCPPSATSVITTTSGSVMCAGKQEGVPYAILGFEIFPFERSKNAIIGVLTLNLFKWLFRGSLDSSELRPLEAFKIGPSTTHVRSVAPSREELSIAPDRTIMPLASGVITIEKSSGEATELRAVNIFSDQESDLLAPQVLTADAAQTIRSTPKRESLDLGSWFAALALGILIVDLIRRVVNRNRWSRQ